jgi:hypothetical protein
MIPETFADLWRIAIPLSTLFMAFASALFGFLAWRSEGTRKRAEARRARLETTIDNLAELFAAIPHDKSRWSEAFTGEFIEKVCRVDFKLDDANPHADRLVKSIQDILPREHANRDEDHMAKFNTARAIAKEYLDVEWKKFNAETGAKG